MQWLERRSWLAYGGFVALTVLWVQTVHGIYSDSGLFWWVGTDFAQYYAQSVALWSADPSNIYRPQSYNTVYQELLRTYIVNQQPVPPTSVPYPPIFAWLFSPFTIPSPPIGFALWETINIAGALYLAWRSASLFPESKRPLVALFILTSFPVWDTLLLAQPQLLLACAVGECYLALRNGRDLAAGLWLSWLLIKPQYGGLIGLFLIWKGRWYAVIGAVLGGMVIVGLSILVAGWDALLAYPLALKEMAVFKGYWEENMINWRSVVLWLRPGVGTFKGMLLTQALAIGTLLALVIVTRGRWAGREPAFSVQFTLVVAATLLITHHSFTYGAVMLILPLAAVFSEHRASRWTEWSVLVIAVAPTLAFTLWRVWSVSFAARIITFGLLSCFASLLWTAWQHQWERQHDRESLPSSGPPLLRTQ